GPLAARKAAATSAPGRERYRRCAKAWLAGSDARRATEPAGLSLEIVPENVPGAAAPLSLRVLRSGRPLPGALVKAWRTPLATAGMPIATFERDSVSVAWQGRSDAGGRVTVSTSAAGEWLVSVVDMQPCRDTGVADWESTWASLTFARLPRAPGAAARR